MQPFGDWRPDVYPYNADVAGEASGVLPRGNSYGPWPQLSTTSPAAATVIRGAFAARTSTNTIAIFALSASKAYKFAGVNTAWTDVTAAAGNYTLAADEYWSIKQFGSVVLAANGSDPLQSIDPTAGVNFAAVAGSPPNSRYLAVVGDFAMLGATATSRFAVKWSSRNDAAGWTAGQKDSDGQTFNDGGHVQGVTGFERGGLVFQSDTVRQMATRSDAAIFEFHRVDPARGTTAPYSIVLDGGDAYYYATNGFTKIGGDGSIGNIGTDYVNEWFRSDCKISRSKAIIGALDPTVRRIFWLYPSTSNATSTTLDRMLCYDIERNRWTHANVNATYIFTAVVPGWTLADIAAVYTTLSSVPYPLGSDVWRGGAPGLAAFDSNNKLAFFSGTPMAGSVQTSIFEPVPGKRGFLNGFRLIGDAVNATGKVGVAERPQTAVTYRDPQTVNAQGRVPARASGRLMQIQIDTAADEDWNDLQGVDFDDNDIIPDGRR